MGDPLRVCVPSTHTFMGRCDIPLQGLRAPYARDVKWCSEATFFCGYQVDLFHMVAGLLGLESVRDYELICVGELGKPGMVESLAGNASEPIGVCDMAIGAVRMTSHKRGLGIQFSESTMDSSLVVVVNRPAKDQGTWACLKPLSMGVWFALSATIAVTPVIIFVFETMFSSHSAYAYTLSRGVSVALKKAMWHAMSHALSVDVMRR